uniref:RING-type E3 ubiquitin transferase n=1 Tax=Parastrongyloides trichosuri TaxID=131310 RepID=A0A0N4ZPU1_PARTI
MSTCLNSGAVESSGCRQGMALSEYDEIRKPHAIKGGDTTVSIGSRTLQTELTCPICLDLLQTTMTSKECLHRFCEPCITLCLQRGNKECPTCRKKLVSKRSLRRDENFDSLINAIFPDRRIFDELQNAVNAKFDEKANLEALQKSIAEGIKAQSSAKKKAKLQVNNCEVPNKRKKKGRKDNSDNDNNVDVNNEDGSMGDISDEDLSSLSSCTTDSSDSSTSDSSDDSMVQSEMSDATSTATTSLSQPSISRDGSASRDVEKNGKEKDFKTRMNKWLTDSRDSPSQSNDSSSATILTKEKSQEKDHLVSRLNKEKIEIELRPNIEIIENKKANKQLKRSRFISINGNITFAHIQKYLQKICDTPSEMYNGKFSFTINDSNQRSVGHQETIATLFESIGQQKTHLIIVFNAL